MGAAMGGYKSCIQLLLERGADPTAINEFGETAYDLAIAKGFPDCAELIHDWIGQSYKTGIKKSS